MSTATPRVLADGFACTEAPRWRHQELYFSDMFGHAVLAVNEAGDVRTVARIQDVPVGLGWLPDGRLLVVGQSERRVLRQEPAGHLVLHADLSAAASSDLNDMCVDHTGRAYVGEVGVDSGSQPTHVGRTAVSPDEAVTAQMRAAHRRPGHLHLVHPDGHHLRLPEPLALPNGMCLSPDRTRLYVNASLEPSVRRFDIDQRGQLNTNTIVATLDSLPDGMSDVDAEGGLWIATPETKSAIRIDANGHVTDRVETDRKCLAVALGGSSGTTLFLCTTVTNDPTDALAHRRSRIETATVRIPAA